LLVRGPVRRLGALLEGYASAARSLDRHHLSPVDRDNAPLSSVEERGYRTGLRKRGRYDGAFSTPSASGHYGATKSRSLPLAASGSSGRLRDAPSRLAFS
jgi:hypothetical protein